MIPVIALIGRPNIGKSTLFNRLTHTRDALVADFPGLTRDRRYGRVKWENHEFIVIDTGGIDGTEKGIKTHIAKQSLLAVQEADIVMFMVDGRSGLITTDQIIAKQIRSYKKTTVIVVNKTDGVDINTAINDFYALGMDVIIPITALHGHGIKNLLKQVLLKLANDNLSINDSNKFIFPEKEKTEKHKKEEELDLKLPLIKLAIVGRPNVGKSTLINCMLEKNRMVVYDIPGTTRDSIYIPMIYKKQRYILIDTAGIRNRSKVTEKIEKFSIIKTLKSITDANVVILVINARENISDQDLSLLRFIIDSGRSLVIAINKWDNLSTDAQNDIKKTLDHRIGFINFARIHFISALNCKNVRNLLVSVNEAYKCATNRMSTAFLTRIMNMAVNEHQPPIVGRKRIKLKYAHAGGYNPPLIVIHGTQINHLQNNYKRYLTNYFRRSLKIIGTPIRVKFNQPDQIFHRFHSGFHSKN